MVTSSTQRADGDAGRRPDERTDDSNQERHSRAVDHPSEEVAAELVGSKEVVQGRRGRAVREVHRQVACRRQERSYHGHDREHKDAA
jgi:hypothetical protein